MSQMETGARNQFDSEDIPPGSGSGLRRVLRAVRCRLRMALGRLRKHHGYQDERWNPLEITPDVLTATRVEDLPFPHHLFKCLYKARFEELMTRFEEPGRAGQEFIARLTLEEASRCPYHQVDWPTIARLSIAVLARIQEGQRRDLAIREISRRFHLTNRDQAELLSLFIDPISWGFGSPQLSNGQHRVCAMKKAGAEFCIVER